jgi:antitoxin StbD
MERLLTNLTASLTELREPNKVIARAGNQPVAIMNRNEAIGYFVPKSAVADVELLPISNTELDTFMRSNLSEIAHVLDYLKDK